jgi:CheY-like chemotaxis protein
MMKKILIVDDNSHNRLLIRMILQQKGFLVIEAEGGKEGLKLALEEKPDLIILDIMMPEIDGWEVMKRLKSNKQTENIPILVFSAVDECKNPEAAGFISKPIDINKLISTITEIIK